MIGLFKHTARQETPSTDPTSLVKQIEAAEAEAHRVLIDAYDVQIRELLRAAEYQLAEERRCAQDIVNKTADPDNDGEGYWEMALAERAAKHVGRYAREARHWQARRTLAIKRWERGQGIEPWTKDDRARRPIDIERCNMEAAQ